MDQCWSGETDEVQWAGEPLVGHLPDASGDVAVSGADLGGVLVEGGVTDTVEPVLDDAL